MGPGATNFPQAIGMAASWDPEIVEQAGRHRGGPPGACRRRPPAALSPVLDIAHDPVGGGWRRRWEDPELASRMGVAFVRGMQGQGVDCCGKHFLGRTERAQQSRRGGARASAACVMWRPRRSTPRSIRPAWPR